MMRENCTAPNAVVNDIRRSWKLDTAPRQACSDALESGRCEPPTLVRNPGRHKPADIYDLHCFRGVQKSWMGSGKLVSVPLEHLPWLKQRGD
jgi:hypothetical protein